MKKRQSAAFTTERTLRDALFPQAPDAETLDFCRDRGYQNPIHQEIFRHERRPGGPVFSGRRRTASWRCVEKQEHHVKGIRPVEDSMAHKKVERKKELDRRRHRREQRLKQRVREARAAKA